MIAGHLQIKNDYYFMVLNYTDVNGKRRQPWVATGLPAKGNKKRAEKMLMELRQSYVPPAASKGNGEFSTNMLFADYMELWLEIILFFTAFVAACSDKSYRLIKLNITQSIYDKAFVFII